MTFWDHLEELRTVLLKSLAAWLVGVVTAFLCKDLLFSWLFAPASSDFVLYSTLCRLAESTGWAALCPGETEVSFLNTELTAQFMTHVEVSLWAGFILALPFIVYWLYGFVAQHRADSMCYNTFHSRCDTGLLPYFPLLFSILEFLSSDRHRGESNQPQFLYLTFHHSGITDGSAVRSACRNLVSR